MLAPRAVHGAAGPRDAEHRVLCLRDALPAGRAGEAKALGTRRAASTARCGDKIKRLTAAKLNRGHCKPRRANVPPQPQVTHTQMCVFISGGFVSFHRAVLPRLVERHRFPQHHPSSELTAGLGASEPLSAWFCPKSEQNTLWERDKFSGREVFFYFTARARCHGLPPAVNMGLVWGSALGHNPVGSQSCW